MNGRALATRVLALLVLASALAVVYTQHLERERFAELERLKAQQARLETQWGRLQLEQSTWATHGRIERIAREELGLRLPDFERAELVVMR
jgi:cell division protein FtsL